MTSLCHRNHGYKNPEQNLANQTQQGVQNTIHHDQAGLTPGIWEKYDHLDKEKNMTTIHD